MTIKDMHYDVKQKLNKIDSQQYRNLRIPEIDWKLNEAHELFVKMIAEPRLRNHLGFETSQRTIDDIRALVVDNYQIGVGPVTPDSYLGPLPDTYMFFLSGYAEIQKGDCIRKVRMTPKQHDDDFQASPFDRSSFEWKTVNMRFYEDGIKVFTDETFEVNELRIDFIRKHVYVHNAEDFLPAGTYNLPDGTALVGSQNSELPDHTHREIVDIAVLLITGDLDNPNYQLKQAKLNLNQIN